MDELIEDGHNGTEVTCRQIAKVLGKLTAMKVSHGHIVTIAT
jgi:hypothetical protein